MTPAQIAKIMALVDEHAGDRAEAFTEYLYGTSKSYAKQCGDEAAQSRAAIESRLREVVAPPVPEPSDVLEMLKWAMTEARIPAEFRADVIGYFCNALNARSATTPQPAAKPAQAEPVAFEMYNPATGHAIVDYSRQTYVGRLTAEMGYEARPLGYIKAQGESAGSCSECGKTSTKDSMWAYYCVECIETKIAPALNAARASLPPAPEPVAGEQPACQACGIEATRYVPDEATDHPGPYCDQCGPGGKPAEPTEDDWADFGAWQESRAPLPSAHGWQTIDSAPKDGTDFLLGHYYVDHVNQYNGPSRWLWITQGAFEDGNFWHSFSDEVGLLSLDGSWKTATHWMPLPPAPEPVAGWQWVPKEPNADMMNAAMDCQDADPEDGPSGEVYATYKAMLAAAPTKGTK